MFYRPAEWLGKRAIYFAWPYDESLWQDNLEGAQEEFLALLGALKKQQKVVLVPDEKNNKIFLQKFILDNNTNILVQPYGDIWLRDTMPIFGKENNSASCVIPKFNGWGNKYLFNDDIYLSNDIKNTLKISHTLSNMIFEGGAIEFDGEGTLITTTQCMLNNNRNPNMSKNDIENEFKRIFNINKIIWLDNGLLNDHTDGHVDTIARFIAPNTVAIMNTDDKKDPNKKVFEDIKSRLSIETDALGRKLRIIELPSAGKILNDEGDVMPASYLNFIFADDLIIMPTYDSTFDEKAIEILTNATQKKVLGLKAKHILSGGGAFHCISQEYFL